MNKKLIPFLYFLLLVSIANAQSFKFAFVSDTHIGNQTAAEDLRRTVKDINANDELKFVVITGDITEFGADAELALAKQILDSLNKKWYIIPGNHDANWSESGSNTFRRVFGAETFAFNYGGYLFTGASSGPNMRMGPGQVPRENIVWLDSVLKSTPAQTPVVYLNHYPQDSAQNNWYNVIDRLKKKNVQLILCGHGHQNHQYTFDGIPGVMGRSNLRAKDSIGGYNIVTFDNNTAYFEERKPIIKANKPWAKVALMQRAFDKDTARYYRPSYAVNQKLTRVKPVWTYQDQSDIGSGMAIHKNAIILTDTKGLIYALNKDNGKRLWSYATQGKIYSTPAVSGNYVVAGSSDQNVYCLSAITGKLVWKAQAEKAIVASPVIKDNVVFIGASDGHFRAIYLNNGKLKWDYNEVKGFVVTKPLIYKNIIYFGCWANDFYALDVNSGKLIWKWNNGSGNRMFSPAACYPVAANGRVFIVAPDRYMTAFDASTGRVIWRKQDPKLRVRESMGISADSSLIYVKTMDGNLLGISPVADSMHVAWKSTLQLPYELCPSAIVEYQGVVFVPTHSGIVYGVDRNSGQTLWKYKVSNCLVNTVLPLNSKVYVSTTDGAVACLGKQ
ncbi:PQQ-binding-like beta-propeller repeat protein [Mucilaginibacter sp. PAMB04168]|uniref:outer membrane protein assembly factor BamB family protein n=1 Tax=Mucilaginibacter sp. PAMB04168 TaxID=3138567 RepID=UPI0031F6664E